MGAAKVGCEFCGSETGVERQRGENEEWRLYMYAKVASGRTPEHNNQSKLQNSGLLLPARLQIKAYTGGIEWVHRHHNFALLQAWSEPLDCG
jgi:hypothetical protein